MSCLKLLFAEIRALVFKGCAVVCLGDDAKPPIGGDRAYTLIQCQPEAGKNPFSED